MLERGDASMEDIDVSMQLGAGIFFLFFSDVLMPP